MLYFTGMIVTMILFKFLSKSDKELRDTFTIFLLTVFFGSILALFVNFDFIHNDTPFLYPDQVHFFEQAQIISLEKSFKAFMSKSLSGEYGEYSMAYAIFGGLGYIDKLISGTVNFFPLLLSVVYTTALIPVFLYHILKLYFPIGFVFKATLFYGLLTPIMAYSGYLLRDMHISLLTIIAFYWIVRDIRVDRVIGLILLIPIIAGFRVANSFLILAMIIIYLFAGKTSKFIRFIFLLIASGILIYFSDLLFGGIESTQNRLSGYIELTSDAIEDSSGIGRYLYQLPIGLRELAVTIFTLSAFPFWSTITFASTLPQYVTVIFSFITNIGSFFILVGVMLNLKSIWIKTSRSKNKILLYLFLLSLLFLLINTANMTFRRIVCIIPFIYIPFLLVYYELSEKQKRFYKIFVLISGILLSIIYFLLVEIL